MPVSKKDLEFMERVAEYFRKTKTTERPKGSIRDTAKAFDLNRNKVRKILNTMGELHSPLTDEAVNLRKKGMSIREIAENLGVSVATVSTSLPYDSKVDNTLDPSDHTAAVRSYREYEKKQKSRQIAKNPQNQGKNDDQVLTDDVSAGFSNQKGVRMSDFFYGNNKKQYGPSSMLRLHMELYDEYPSEKLEHTLKKYGMLHYGDSISRDILVPADIPLYALHYVIQRAFGWQNSHLHEFVLPDETFRKVTENRAGMWRKLVGIIFRSPLMPEDDEFWTDDYSKGSFKNWLRKKYTGPYLSLCHGEGLISCWNDMKRIDPNEKYYLISQNTSAHDPNTQSYDSSNYIYEAFPMYDYAGRKKKPPKPWWGEDKPYSVTETTFGELPPESISMLFERNTRSLLERLPVSAIFIPKSEPFTSIKAGNNQSTSHQISDNAECLSGSDIYRSVEKDMHHIIEKGIDQPNVQVVPPSFTDTLIYKYDFGDDWKVRITASQSADDLIESGRLTQTKLDRSVEKCFETYRPVLLARDGEMLIDDVGGIYGFSELLKQYHEFTEKVSYGGDDGFTDSSSWINSESEQTDYDLVEWAINMGWHWNESSNFTLL